VELSTRALLLKIWRKNIRCAPGEHGLVPRAGFPAIPVQSQQDLELALSAAAIHNDGETV
jgi:hypothetical protein